MLDHEPAVGLAIVDSRCRAIHANRRFVALTQLPPDTSSAAGAPAGADRRKGVWARIGPEAVHTAAAERRPAVVHFIHEGVQVQCDVWPLPSSSVSSGGGSEPMFLVLAVEGRQDPNDAPADEAAPGMSAGGVVEASAAKTAQRFVTLAPLMAELGALSALTARELEVLALIGQGMATREIAESLGRSPRTVERHCDAIHKKLGTTNRVQMARYAMQAGLTAEAGKLKRV
ncbi:MAG: response regulator transcription factor [Phycisphaerales bacterium JB064]